MSKSQTDRIVRKYRNTVAAEPARVFPLLCPVLEYEWIDGWECEIIYSQSGVAENNCIFATNFEPEGRTIWAVSLYEPENFRIEFVTVTPGLRTGKLDLKLTEPGPGQTHVSWTYTFTALNDAGREHLKTITEEAFMVRMTFLDESLNHYCRTGQKLLKEEAAHGRHQ